MFVAVLVLWTAAELGSGFVILATAGYFGWDLTPDGRVMAVERGAAAADAGLRPGDRIRVETLTSDERRLLQSYKAAGTKLSVEVVRGQQSRRVRLTSRPVPVTLDRWAKTLIAASSSAVFPLIGTILLLLKPNRVTWAFFVFCCGEAIMQAGELRALLHGVALNVDTFALTVALLLTLVGGIAFMARFPDGATGRVSRAYERIALGASALLALNFGLRVGGVLTPPIFLAMYDGGLLLFFAITIGIVVYRALFEMTSAMRARVRWVLVGMCLGLGSYGLAIALRLTRFPGFSDSYPDLLLQSTVVLIPLSVAYAVLRHHVFDVRFAISRASVYTAFTSVAIVVFSLIELTVKRRLVDERMAGYAELAVAIGAGFWFQTVHRRVERFFDSLFFRDKHDAQRRLERVVRAVPHAPSAQAVDRFLIIDPFHAYRLTAAALLRRDESGDFHLTASEAWPSDGSSFLSHGDALVALLEAEPVPVDLDDMMPSHPSLSAPAGTLAVPVAMRHRLRAIALYAPTRGGEVLDPDQRRLLAHLAGAAAGAYDHLEAEELRAEIASLRARLSASPT